MKDELASYFWHRLKGSCCCSECDEGKDEYVCFFMDQIWVSHEQELAGGSLKCSQALEEGK